MLSPVFRAFAVGSLVILAGCSSFGIVPSQSSQSPLPQALAQPDVDTTAAYYRFENGPAGHVAGRIVDSSKNHLDGSVLAGAPTYATPVPVSFVPRTRRADTLSLSIGTSDALQFPYAFPFQNFTNATLEFWIDPSSPTGGDVVWGTLTAGDTNRFEIGFGSSFGPAFMNYRDPSGVLHRLGRAKVSTPAGEWTFLAFVKEGNRYSIYVNNSQTQHITTLESRTIDGSPNLPAI